MGRLGKLWRAVTAVISPFTEPTAGLTDMGFTSHKTNNTGSGDISLIYMNARYYLPDVGRFLNADTIVLDPTNPQSFNRYSYIRNTPVNGIDSTGHREEDCLNGGCNIPPPAPLIEFTGLD